MGRKINSFWFCLWLLVIVCACSRQESIKPKASPAEPSVAEPALTSHVDRAHSENIQAEGVVMSGVITAADGTALPFCTLNSQARDVSGRPVDREPVTTTVTIGEDGSYAVSNLSLSYYTFSIEAEGYSPYVTNILLTALDTRVDFVFPALTNIHVTGRVIVAETQEPAERVPVILATTAGGKRQQTVNTDTDGRFSFQAPAIKGIAIGSLAVEEPGYVPITCNLEARYRSQEVDLYLKRGGVIKGVVRTTDGVPVKGVTVIARPDQPWESRHRRSLVMVNEKESTKWQTTAIHACYPSDENGAYSISNVPAPGAFSVDIDSDSYVLASPFSEAESRGGKKIKLQVPDNRDIVCNVSVDPKKVIIIRLLDENKSPVSPYNLNISESEVVVCDKKINSTNWIGINIENVNIFPRPGRPMHIRADYWDGRYAEDREYLWQERITNQIELTLSTGMFYVSGTINYPDGTPASGIEVYAGKERVYSDAAGYFAVYGPPVSQDTQVTVKATTEEYLFRLSTNILIGTENVELTFNSLKYVKGRILRGKPPQPATDFKIVTKNGFRYYDSPDGRFTYTINPRSLRGVLGFMTPGYSMREISYDVSTNIVCDLGDILFTNAAAAIKGTVVDQHGSPLSKWIIIRCTDKPTPDWFISYGLNSNPQDGTFCYADLSPGTFYIEVDGRIMGSEQLRITSETIRLATGEIKELPPIVINQSNSAMRCLTFILPDGEPAAFARIDLVLKYTDDRGQISMPIREGRYAGLKASIGKDTYISEPFEIEEDTDELTIQLLSETVMKGTATCDGEPLKRGYLKLYARNSLSSYSCKVTEGTYEAHAPAGEYIAVNSSKHAYALVNLEPEKENAIAFETSNGSMKIPNPFQGERGGIQAFIRIDGHYVFCGMASTRENEEYVDMKNMPPGRYRLEIKPGFGSSNTERHIIETTLADNEQKTLALPQK